MKTYTNECHITKMTTMPVNVKTVEKLLLDGFETENVSLGTTVLPRLLN